MSYFTYILRSGKDGKNYIGSTSDLARRILWHNEGKNVSTKHRVPLRLIYKKEFTTKQEALRYETWLKKQKGGFKVKLLIKDFNSF